MGSIPAGAATLMGTNQKLSSKNSSQENQDLNLVSLSKSLGISEPDLKKMIETGIYWGHKPSKTHPKMKEYIEGLKSNVTVFDLKKIYQKIKEAQEYLEKKFKENPNLSILFLGTTPPAKKPILEIAKKFNYPYVVERWVGGTLTNFKVISERLKYFKELEEKKEKGELQKYSKKEQLDFERELKRLERLFGGIKNLENLPDLLFIVNVSEKNHKTAIREANRVGIPIMAIVDTDGDPEPIEVVIPGNDNSKSAIEFVLEKLTQVIEKYHKVKDKNKDSTESKELNK